MGKTVDGLVESQATTVTVTTFGVTSKVELGIASSARHVEVGIWQSSVFAE